jgi:hypothetical protein
MADQGRATDVALKRVKEESGLLGKEVHHTVSHKPVLTAWLPAVREAGEGTVQ